MKCPDTDPGFATSPVHGADAQRRLVKAVLQVCRKRRRAVDVGAHIGTWTLPLAEVFEHVEAFEPVCANYRCLETNTDGHGNVKLHEIALGREHRRCRVVNLGSNSGCGFAATGGDHLMMPLDEFELTDVDFIKADVEGLEGDVLVGAARTIEHSRPVVFFEDNGLGATHYGATWTDPKTVLSALGYRHHGRIQKNEIWVYA